MRSYTSIIMKQVFFKKADYDEASLKTVIFDMMNNLGGDKIRTGDRVLIKPNFLTPAKPEKAVLTHPLIVKAVAEYVLEKSGHPQISDSPAVGSFKKILKEGGYNDAFAELNVEFKPFEDSVKVNIGEPFGEIDLAKDITEADMIINLPKLKTHAQMLLTLGVKNMFGTVVGLKKPEWHLRVGVDRDMFAKLLVRIYNAVNPCMTIIDGILAMEGDGPGKGGTPSHIGILVGSTYAPAADLAICRMLEIEPDRLPTHKAAKSLGLIGDESYITGDFIKISQFRLPEPVPLTFGPKPFQKLIRKYVIQRPVADEQMCRLCGECWKFCPAKAITPPESTGDQGIVFDYDKCIRCYCCVEVCPHGAIRAAETMIGRFMKIRELLGIKD